MNQIIFNYCCDIAVNADDLKTKIFCDGCKGGNRSGKTIADGNCNNQIRALFFQAFKTFFHNPIRRLGSCKDMTFTQKAQ